MATLDGNDLQAIKQLIEVTIDEVIEEKGLVTKEHITSHLKNTLPRHCERSEAIS